MFSNQLIKRSFAMNKLTLTVGIASAWAKRCLYWCKVYKNCISPTFTIDLLLDLPYLAGCMVR